MKSNQGSSFNNLSKKTEECIRKFRSRSKYCDSGSIVILNKNDYNEECLKIVCNRHFYEELKEDPSAPYKDKITDVIQKLLHDSLITKNEYDILLEGNETPTFYALAKTHKIFEKLPHFDPFVMAKIQFLYGLQSLWIAS